VGLRVRHQLLLFHLPLFLTFCFCASMTDRKYLYKLKMYCYRVALHRNSPSCVAFLLPKPFQDQLLTELLGRAGLSAAHPCSI